MVTEKIWLPFYTSPLPNGDQFFLRSLRKGGVSYVLRKLSKTFQKHITCPPFVATEKNLVATMFDNWKNSITIPCGDQNIFWSP